MTGPHATRELLTALDSLNEVDPAVVERGSRLPFRIVAVLALLIAAILAVALTEDRKYEQIASERTATRHARELSIHARATADAVAIAARALPADAGPEALAALAPALHDRRNEIVSLALLDATGAVLAEVPPDPAGGHRGTGIVAGRAEVPRREVGRAAPARQPALDRFTLDAPAPDAAGVPTPALLRLDTPTAAGGALSARIDPQRLLARLAQAAPDAIGQGVVLKVGARTIAALDEVGADRPARLATVSVAVPALPDGIALWMTAQPEGPGLASDFLLIAIASLGVAAGVTLLVLTRSMRAQERRDRALQAETALRRAMESSLATGMRVIDLDGVIRYVNPAFCRMTGWSADTLIGRGPPFPYWPPELAAEHATGFAALLAGRLDPAGIEVVVARPDGSRFDAHMYVSSLVDRDGRQIGWLTSMADTTEANRIRRALLDARERFATVLESLEAAVSVSLAPPAEAPLLLANRAYVDAFGASPDAHLRLAREARGQADVAVLDAPTQRWYDVRMREIAWVDGHAARLQIASDITRRKLTEEIIAQQQQSIQLTARLITMGEMASSLAHELNQPLTAITNYSEGMLARTRAGTLAPADLLNALQKTAAQAQRAGNIIRRIREFVKRSEPRLKPCPAQRIIEEAVGFAEIELRKRGIAIEVDVAPGLPPLLVDPLLIEQVLLNVIRNGADAMEQAAERRITVQVRRAPGPQGAAARVDGSPGMAQIAVRDHGTGIAAEHLPRLFQPFFSTKAEGMGMGLNICRSIVEFHHGRLVVENAPAPGAGAITRFTLPLAPTTPAATPPSSSPPVAAEPQTPEPVR